MLNLTPKKLVLTIILISKFYTKTLCVKKKKKEKKILQAMVWHLAHKKRRGVCLSVGLQLETFGIKNLTVLIRH